MYKLTDKEKKLLQRVSSSYYMEPILGELAKKSGLRRNGLRYALASCNKMAAQRWKKAFDHLHEVLVNSQGKVELLLEERQRKGEIKSKDQARKSIAGNAFANLLIYTFLRNKECENIPPHIFINNRVSEVKGFQNLAVIQVGDETQKPDVDVVVYTVKDDGVVDKSIILSLKTSLRERVGQTYKWKLLLEIATTDNPIKDKYGIKYALGNPPLVCFATVNFYEEIDQPQHRGMFKFFDGAFIAKPIERDFIKPLSALVDFVSERLS